MEHRLVCRGASTTAAATALREYADGHEPGPSPVTQGKAIANKAKVAFIFSGNGSQWAGMGVMLLADPVFKKSVGAVDRLIRARAGWSVIAELKRPAAESRMGDTRYAQPLLLAVQIGIIDALGVRGLRPEGVAGHSVGEVAAPMRRAHSLWNRLSRSSSNGRPPRAGHGARV